MQFIRGLVSDLIQIDDNVLVEYAHVLWNALRTQGLQ